MPQTIARGQITFVDLNDGKNISLYLVSNRPLTQLYDVDTHEFAPSYDTQNLVITPNLFVTDASGNQMSKTSGVPTWTINGTVVNSTNFPSGVSVAATSPYALTISRNAIVNSTFMTIQCTVSYVDEDTQLTTPATAQITITKVDTTGELIRAVAYANDTPIFYNVDTEGSQSVVLHCDMWRGASVDNTAVTYQWYRKDDPSGADAYDWHKIVASFTGTGGSAATGTFNDGSTWKEVLKGSLTGYNTSDLTVTSDDIQNYDGFMCVCTDIDDGHVSDNASGTPSATYGTSVRSDVISVMDWTDPYTIDFMSPAGTSMTRGTTSLTTTVSVYQKGQELAGSVQNAFYYLWTKASRLGIKATGIKVPGYSEVDPDDYKASDNNATPTEDSSWERRTFGSDTVYCRYSTGENARTIQVYRNEVKVKSTFFVEVVIP